MEVSDVVLHLGGGIDEKFHFSGRNLQDSVFAVHLLVAIGDEGVGILQGVQSAKRRKDKDCVGDEGTFHNHLLPLEGRVGGGHRAIGT